MKKKSVFNLYVVCILLIATTVPGINALVNKDKIESDIVETQMNIPDIYITHPGEKHIYIGTLYESLSNKWPNIPFTIILGHIAYCFTYGITVYDPSRTVVKVEVYSNNKYCCTLDPIGQYGGVKYWKVNWCPIGLNEIKVVGYNEHGSTFTAKRKIFAI